MPLLRLFILFFIVSTCAFSQQDSLVVKQDKPTIEIQEITEDHLKHFKADKAFNYNENKSESSWFKSFKRWVRNIFIKILEAIFGVEAASGIFKFIFGTLPYILLAILIFLLIKFFLKVNSRNIINGSQKVAKVTFTDEEQIIKNENISALITEAVKQNNYRLAIRYYYLLALKELSENNTIDWQQDKTNEDYIKEISKNTIKFQFEKITRIYDYVWYGEFKVDEIKYENLKLEFISLSNKLKN